MRPTQRNQAASGKNAPPMWSISMAKMAMSLRKFVSRLVLSLGAPASNVGGVVSTVRMRDKVSFAVMADVLLFLVSSIPRPAGENKRPCQKWQG